MMSGPCGARVVPKSAILSENIKILRKNMCLKGLLLKPRTAKKRGVNPEGRQPRSFVVDLICNEKPQENHIELCEESQQVKFRIAQELQMQKTSVARQASLQLEEPDYMQLYMANSEIRESQYEPKLLYNGFY